MDWIMAHRDDILWIVGSLFTVAGVLLGIAKLVAGWTATKKDDEAVAEVETEIRRLKTKWDRWTRFFPARTKTNKTKIMSVLLFLVLLSGCAWNDQLRKIPNVKFTKFEWKRGGNFSSAAIYAQGASIENGVIKINHISLTENWGPFFDLSVSLEGYERVIPPADLEKLPYPVVELVPKKKELEN